MTPGYCMEGVMKREPDIEIQNTRKRPMWQVGSPDKILTSSLVSPKTMFYIRFMLFVYVAVVQGIRLTYIKKEGYIKFFFKFTNLSFLGLFIYFSSIMYFSYRYSKDDLYVKTFARKSVFLHLFLELQFTALLVFHTIIPIVFWTMLFKTLPADLAPQNAFEWWVEISIHGLDFLIIFIDFVFTDLVLRPLCLVYVFVSGISYYLWIALGALTLTHTTEDGRIVPYYPYRFLNVQRYPKTAYVFYPSFLIFGALIFWVFYGVRRLKLYIIRRK